MWKDLFTIRGRWGRLNRLRYFSYGIIAGAVLLVGMPLSGEIGGETLFNVYLGIYFIALCWISVCLGVKRLHDLGRSG